MDSSSLIALAALVIASATAWRALKSYRAGQRSELPEVRVSVQSQSKPSCKRILCLSLQKPDSPVRSSWEIVAVEAIGGRDVLKCLSNGGEWRHCLKFSKPLRPGRNKSFLVCLKSSEVVLTCLFKSPRRSRWRSLFSGTRFRWIPFAWGMAWEERWGDAIRVYLKPREGDVSGTD